ncbi:MAG: hypothetical protein J6Q13_01230 [Clostridia bacterium]|nr:hypothetical protein [Clostridia bacterium]
MNITSYEKENIINKICEFFKLERPSLIGCSVEENIKELCVARLCKAIGINCSYNYKNDFFSFFSNIMGEALCEKLNFKIHVAGAEFRYVKYDHVNLVEEIKFYLDTKCVEEAFIDAFNFVDKFKYLIPQIKKFSSG